MRILLSFFAFLMLSFNAFAQDKLYKQDGEVITVNVLEIDDELVTYTLFSTPNGSSFKVSKALISKIVYKNGSVEEFGSLKSDGSMLPFKPSHNKSMLGNNIISYDLPSLFFANVYIAYERILGNGMIGLKIPVVFGLDPYKTDWGFDLFNLTYIKYKTGLDLNLYPTGQGKVRFLIGPGFRVGQVISSPHNINYGDGTYSLYQAYATNNLTSFQGNMGFIYTPVRNFTLSFTAFAGYRWLKDVRGRNIYQSERPTAGINLTVGFRI